MPISHAAFDAEFVRIFREGETTTKELERLLKRVTWFIHKSHDTLYPEADEIASEAVLLAYEKIDTFRGDSSFLSWIFGIAYNIAMNRARQLGKASMPHVDKETCDRISAQALAAEFDDDANLRTWALEEALSSLKDYEHEVIRLRIMEQHSSKEVAEALGKTDAAVRQMEHRACVKMRNYLLENGYADLFVPLAFLGVGKSHAVPLAQESYIGQQLSAPP